MRKMIIETKGKNIDFFDKCSRFKEKPLVLGYKKKNDFHIKKKNT